jgi:phosphoribosylamine--glycine ligase
MAKVLVVGGGGREQALAWKLAQSPSVEKVYVAPGNGGSRGKIENVPIAFDDDLHLLAFALKEKIDLTVIGQEATSEAGVVDTLKESGLVVFGPDKAAVRIETSKAFSKDLMAEQNIPTAQYKNFSDPEEASKYAKGRSFPVVIKADGLAGGKGVIIAQNVPEINKTIDDIMVNKVFGTAGDTVVVEDFLHGQEVSIHALCDGTRSVMFPPSQDHKQIYDGDKGPNTGGMGAYAPVPWISEDAVTFVKEHAVEPALRGLAAHQAEFRGCLYPGLMIDGNDIKLLEFNARFGDPEAEVYMRLLDGDLYAILRACALGTLDPNMVKWKPGFAVTVVLASGGYPGDYQKGLPIQGLETAASVDDVVIFHAGTALKYGQVITAGGRVLNVTATAETLDAALEKAYAAVKLISFEGMQYRSDIGKRPQ